MVSIPFKRDRLSEPGAGFNKGTPLTHLFQFPSNGIGFPNNYGPSTIVLPGVKFQFPSNGKGFPNAYLIRTLIQRIRCFNSLQTGKAFRTAHGKNKVNKPNVVSIPFKRERLPEPHPLGSQYWCGLKHPKPNANFLRHFLEPEFYPKSL